MQAIVAIPVVLGIYAAQLFGRLYGWGYHVAILIVLATYTGFMCRLALGKRPKEQVDLSVFESSDPDAKALGAKLAEMHSDTLRFHDRFRVDAFVIPALLFAPMIVALLSLGDSVYSPEYRRWHLLGFVLILPYAFFRYALPKRKV